MLSVTISCLFFLQRISWFCLFLFIIINVVYGFSFFCSSKIFLNAVSLPPMHLTYHNSQTNLFKALLLSFYLLAQAFPMVLPISSNKKFFSITTEALCSKPFPHLYFLTILQHKTILWSGQWFLQTLHEPVLHIFSSTSVLWLCGRLNLEPSLHPTHVPN